MPIKPKRLSESDKARLLKAVELAWMNNEQYADLHLKLRKHFLLEEMEVLGRISHAGNTANNRDYEAFCTAEMDEDEPPSD